MEQFIPHDTHVFRARLDRSGRITLPQQVRDGLHLASGDEVLVVQNGDGYRIETPEQALRAAQDYFCSLIPADADLVDELLAERRAEVAREAADEAGTSHKGTKRPRE